MNSLSALPLALLLVGEPAPVHQAEEIPFVPTPTEVVDRMLEIAEVKKDDVVYDLGSGDGRIVIYAAKKYGVRAVGIEMDSWLVAEARAKAKEEGVEHLVEFRIEDGLKADISPATVVTLYMLPWFNEMMRPKLQNDLKPGSRVVAHDYGIEGWPPARTEVHDKVEIRPGGLVHRHTIYLWKIGPRPQ